METINVSNMTELTIKAALSPEELQDVTCINIQVKPDELGESSFFAFRFSELITTLVDKAKNLDELSIGFGDGTEEKILKYNLNILDHLPNSLRELAVFNIDMSREKLDFLATLPKMEFVTLSGCNLSDISFIKKLSKSVNLSLDENPINPKYAKLLIDEINSRNIVMVSGANEVLERAQLLGLTYSKYINDTAGFPMPGEEIDEDNLKVGDMTLGDYILLRGKYDLTKIKDIRIHLDGAGNLPREARNQALKELMELPQSIIIANLNQLGKFKIPNPVRLQIRNAAELTIEKVEKLRKEIDLVEVQTKDGYNTPSIAEQGMPYFIDDYVAIRGKIDDIISRIKMPSDNEPNREKIIFLQVYDILGKSITYDHANVALKDSRTPTCGNMYGGLLDGTCVCAGYADLLRNILACTGIEARYIIGYRTDEKTQKDRGHAWNQVFLDGEWFNTDLTWDALEMNKGRIPRSRLKSDIDFRHTDFSKWRTPLEATCTRSLEEKELFALRQAIRDIPTELSKADITAEEVVDVVGEFMRNMQQVKEPEKDSTIER